jgi:hypothetical protein
MHGANAASIQKAMDELAALYREDEITLSQQLIWMEIFRGEQKVRLKAKLRGRLKHYKVRCSQ